MNSKAFDEFERGVEEFSRQVDMLVKTRIPEFVEAVSLLRQRARKVQKEMPTGNGDAASTTAASTTSEGLTMEVLWLNGASLIKVREVLPEFGPTGGLVRFSFVTSQVGSKELSDLSWSRLRVGAITVTRPKTMAMSLDMGVGEPAVLVVLTY